MNITDLAELGYTCGLQTLEEALLSVELHWDAFNAAQRAQLQTAVDGVDLSTACSSVLGAQRCAQIDAQLDTYFSSHPSGDEFFEVRDGVLHDRNNT